MSTRSAIIAAPETREAERIAVVLAGSEPAARSRLKQLLEREHDMSVIAEASHLEGVRRYVREHRPDVVVLALRTGGLPTLGALRVLFGEARATRYVVMNSEQEAEQGALADAIRLATCAQDK